MSEHLRVKCNEALKQERKTELQLAAAQTKVKKLRRRCKKLQETSDGDKTETADAFLAFAKNDCLEFCNQVHKTFPREIRDTIYSYITGFEDINIDCDKHGNLEYTGYGYPAWGQELCHDPAYDGTDHWWKPEYVGAAMVCELGESFYRSSCFVFQGDLAALGPFRATDQWNLGFSPVDFVSKVEVKINCQDYKFKITDRRTPTDLSIEPHHSQSSARMLNKKNMRINSPLEKLLVKLESLFGFRAGTKIAIELLSHHPGKFTALEQQEWMSHNVVPVILPVLTRLKATGCRVRILLSVDSRWPSTTFASAWDQICFEAITKEFWEHVGVEQKRITQAELDAEPLDDSDDGTVPAGAWSVVPTSTAWDDAGDMQAWSFNGPS
ncbi:hypothetical protein J4E93_009781 [Alternaria ventricosa]|uniref:uncharacterized protein n=1 Tax=Alternaria ventricosa TaxID=1187951 RepID=UPI0020C3C945|nr:uncharacterized protein J4E93_009781 [Alternaria ventricosa]KAI4638753.1 hypothetical protein J4E93_009781 [Alternaria ventricosa]